MASNDLTFMVEDATIRFRNFSGRKTEYNQAGKRNFAVEIPPDEVEGLISQGWNVKEYVAKDDGDPSIFYIPVAVGFEFKPPHIVIISSKARTHVTEAIVDQLDTVEIEKVDLIARASEWEVNGKTGIKAYLQTMFVTIREDELQLKYAVRDEPAIALDE